MTATTLNERDPTVDQWLQPISKRLVTGNYYAVFIAMKDDYLFDGMESAIGRTRLPVVVFDYSEYGYDASWRNSHIFGVQPNHSRVLQSEGEYLKLHEWLSKQNIIAYFKREFTTAIKTIASSLPFPIYPVELLSGHQIQGSYNKDHWMSRIGGVFHLYGNSHQDRKKLHGALQARWDRTINNLQSMSACYAHNQPFHLLEQVEWFNRYPMDYVLASQSGCMLSVALPGFGVKCFRSSEACQTSVPVMADLGMEWAVPWSCENAVMLPTYLGKILIEASIQTLELVLADKEALFKRLAPAIDASKRLQIDYYVDRYINRNILRAL